MRCGSPSRARVSLDRDTVERCSRASSAVSTGVLLLLTTYLGPRTAWAGLTSITWPMTSLQQRLVKTGGRLIKHARYYGLLLAESHLTRRLFGTLLQKIPALPSPTG